MTSTNKPLASANSKPRIFYGWYIVWAMFTVSLVLVSMGTTNLGFFVKPMRDELGFTRADFGWMNTARMLAAALSSVMIGRLLDRYGPRFLLVTLAIAMGMLMVSMSFVTQAWQAIFIFIIFGLLGLSNGTSLITATTPAKWFIRKRAQAMAYVYLGIPLGIVFSYPLTQWLISEYGWNKTWMILGIGGVLILLPIAFLFLRRAPEDMGLLPDGDASLTSADSKTSVSGAIEGHQWTRAEAIKTPAFWILSGVFGIQMFSTMTINIFRVPFFQDQGISDTVVSYIGPSDGITCAAMALGVATMVGKFGARKTAMIGFVLLASNGVFIILTREPVMMFVSSAAWGISLGILGVIQNTIWADFYGRQNLGAIRGLSMFFVMGFAAFGSPLSGYVADLTGSFELIWWATSAALVGSAILIAVVPSPLRKLAK